MPNLMMLQGKVQNYPWGGTSFIPKLLNRENTENTPWAEYWLGAHRSAPSQLANCELLPEYIAKHQLPELRFLMKVLDVADMLSIQVHPTRTQAEAGFALENNKSIPLDAANRNYKDNNDKPELAVALSEFWLLHGFNSLEAISKKLNNYIFLTPLHQELKQNGLARAFEFALDTGNSSIQQMHQSLKHELEGKNYCKSDIEFWMKRWMNSNPGIMNGILTLFFLNLVKMDKGEAIYQPPGLLHAYLEGQNIELMANSDNVLRAGLTPKHMDVPELLNICQLQPTNPADYLIQPDTLPSGERVFCTPFEHFELSCLESDRANEFSWCSNSLEILLCYEGKVEAFDGSNQIDISQGQSILVKPGSCITLKGRTFSVYRAINK